MKIVAKGITVLSVILFLLAVCALDSESIIPKVVVVVTEVWMIGYLVANDWFDDWEDRDEDN